DAACDDVALGMTSRLFGSQEAGIHLLLNQRVVFGKLAHFAVADEIDARITDVSDQVAGLREQQRRDGATHPKLVPLRARSFVDSAICVPQRLSDAIVRIAGSEVVQIR